MASNTTSVPPPTAIETRYGDFGVTGKLKCQNGLQIDKTSNQIVLKPVDKTITISAPADFQANTTIQLNDPDPGASALPTTNSIAYSFKNVIPITTASKTLTSANVNSLVQTTVGTSTITFPAVSSALAGMQVDVVIGASITAGNIILQMPAGKAFCYVLSPLVNTAGNFAATSGTALTNGTITFVTGAGGAVPGDSARCICDGSHWFVTVITGATTVGGVTAS